MNKKQAKEFFDRLFKKHCPYDDCPLEKIERQIFRDENGTILRKERDNYYCPKCERLFEEIEGVWLYSSPKDGRWRPVRKGLRTP